MHPPEADTNVVRQAVEVLNKHLKHPNSMIPLLELLSTSPFAEIRQLAAVVMRKKIVGHWGKLKADVQKNLQAVLLELLVKDNHAPTRKAVQELIVVIARILVPAGQWNELLEFLFKCFQSPQAEHREAALSLFNSMVELFGDNLKQHFDTFRKIFLQGLQDSEGKVRIAALRAAGSMVQWLDKDVEVMMFKDILPMTFAVIKLCLSNGFDEDAIRSFEVFDDLLELPMPIVSNLVPDLVKFSLELGSNTQLDSNVREQALTIVEWAAQYKPKSLPKNNLITPIFQVIFPLCALPDEDNEDDEDDVMTLHRFAAHVVDVMARHVPSKHVFQPAMEFVGKYLTSTNPTERKAAVISLAMLAEGCADPMTENEEILTKLLTIIYTAIQDTDQSVREGACIALGQFSTHLQPEISHHYQNVLPLLFKSLDDPTEKVKMGSCYALEAFCQNLGPEILPFLQPLLEKLIQVLQKGNSKIQDIAISAISSTAAAAGKAFLPFSNTLLAMMKQLMSSDDESTLVLRCRATECAGLIASAIGREAFEPYIKEFMDMGLRGCALEEQHELREYTYGFFANVAEILKADFAPYLPIVIPFLLASCDSTDGVVGVGDDDDDEDGIEADEEEGGDVSLTVRTAFLDEKSSACHNLGLIAQHVGAPFVPYIERIMQSFNTLTSYFHEYVRQAVFTSLKQMVGAVNQAFPPTKPYEQGMALDQYQLHSNTKQFVDVVIPVLLSAMEKDDDKECVIEAGEALQGIAELLGPVSLASHLNHIVTIVGLILKRKAPCQIHEEDDEDEDQDLDVKLIDMTFELLIKMAKMMGGHFDPGFQVLYPAISRFYQSKSQAETYRSLAIGCLAEICNAMGPASAKYVDPMMNIAVRAMSDPDPETRNNAIFFCGVCLFHGGNDGLKYYNQALVLLADLFSDTSLPNILDNSCGAICRLILANPTAVPLHQVLPVLLKALPLKIDFEENKTVFPCLIQLFKSSNEVIGANLGLAVGAFARSMKTISQDNIKQELVAIIKSVGVQYPAQMEQIFKQLTQEEQETVSLAMKM